MSASVNDKVTDTRNAARPASTIVSSPRSSGGTTLACSSLTGWPTASKVHFVTYRIDANSDPVAGTQLDCTGIVSGSNIGSFTVIDGTDTGNAVNDVVEMLPTAAWAQDLADALTNQHSRTGTHTGITNTSGITTDTLTVTSGSTLPAGDIITADLAADAVTAAKLADDAVFPANLTSGLSGSSWAWQAWVPSWTNLTVGNGTVTAKYVQIGKTVHYRLYFIAGTTSSSAGAISFSLPVTSVTYPGTAGNHPIGITNMSDAGVSVVAGLVMWLSTTTASLRYLNVTAALVRTDNNVTGAVPWTLGDADELFASGSYEAA